jgi:hypothetical protein
MVVFQGSYGLIGKHYPALTADREYRPKRASVYEIAAFAPLRGAVPVESWSGIFERLA